MVVIRRTVSYKHVHTYHTALLTLDVRVMYVLCDDLLFFPLCSINNSNQAYANAHVTRPEIKINQN